jgi:glutaredoxin
MSGKSALIGIVVVLLVGAGAGGYLWLERRHAAHGTVADRTLPPLELRGRRLSYTFVDTGGAMQTVESRDEVPDDAREFVRVDVPTVRRTDRTASLIYVADLRAPKPDGSFPYAVWTEAQFRDQVLPQSSDTSMHVKYEPEPEPPPLPKKGRGKGGGKSAAKGSGAPKLPELVRGPGGVPGYEAQAAPPSPTAPLRTDKTVTLYTTQWCPACTRARAWLRGRGVSYVDRDIENDPGAKAEYEQKTARLGQSCCRVPGVEIGGTLMIGFAPGRVESLLRR